MRVKNRAWLVAEALCPDCGKKYMTYIYDDAYDVREAEKLLNEAAKILNSVMNEEQDAFLSLTTYLIF